MRLLRGCAAQQRGGRGAKVTPGRGSALSTAVPCRGPPSVTLCPSGLWCSLPWPIVGSATTTTPLFRTATATHKSVDSPFIPHGRPAANPVTLVAVLDAGAGLIWRGSSVSCFCSFCPPARVARACDLPTRTGRSLRFSVMFVRRVRQVARAHGRRGPLPPSLNVRFGCNNSPLVSLRPMCPSSLSTTPQICTSPGRPRYALGAGIGACVRLEVEKYITHPILYVNRRLSTPHRPKEPRAPPPRT